MTAKIMIVDGEGSKRTVGVTANNALKVLTIPGSVSNLSSAEVAGLAKTKQLASFFLNSSSSKDLNIDGSVSSQEFFVAAESNRAKWFTRVRILLNDTSMEINTNDFRRFGTAAIAPGLTNGLLFYAEQGGITTNFFIDPIRNIGNFLDYADSFVNLVNSVGTQEDFLSFDYIFETPIVLVPGSQDRIVITVRDDLSSVDLFTVIGRGYQEEI